MLALESSLQFVTSTKSSWPHLDENTVIDRLRFLAEHPNLIYQGANGLCGEATFYHHLLQRAVNKGLFFTMGSALFRDGVCNVGELKIDPRPRLLESDYSQIVTDRGSTLPPIAPQADWMLLTALRDSFNFWSHHYEGKPEQSSAESSSVADQLKWYRRCRLYRSSEVDFVATTHDAPPISKNAIFHTVRKTSTNHILLGINLGMIVAGTDEDHAISLESELVFKDTLGQVIPTDDDSISPSESSNWTVSFSYWTWAQEPPYATVDMSFDNFSKYLHAAIVAPYDP
jgi:hypothetical protein